MSSAYWAQYSYSEIMSIHGVELNECPEEDIDYDYDECDQDECEESCPRCSGSGCNYCLMCSY